MAVDREFVYIGWRLVFFSLPKSVNRFEDAVGSIIRGSADDETVLYASLELLEGLRKMKNGGSQFLIELLDPRGRSQIIHDESTIRELMENEKQSLDMGPEVPVFDLS